MHQVGIKEKGIQKAIQLFELYSVMELWRDAMKLDLAGILVIIFLFLSAFSPVISMHSLLKMLEVFIKEREEAKNSQSDKPNTNITCPSVGSANVVSCTNNILLFTIIFNISDFTICIIMERTRTKPIFF